MTSLWRKTVWRPNTSFQFLTFFFIFNKRWTFIPANKQLSSRRISQKSQEWVSFSISTCNICQSSQLSKFWLSFWLVLLWKLNNNYSETTQCKELLRKTAKTCQFMTKKGTLKGTKTFKTLWSHDWWHHVPLLVMKKIIRQNITFPQIFSAVW